MVKTLALAIGLGLATKIQAEIFTDMKNQYPIICNCNFERTDKVMLAVRAVEHGLTDDIDLVEALEALEETLIEHADSDHVDSVNACRVTEEAVRTAYDAVAEDIDEVRRARYGD